MPKVPDSRSKVERPKSNVAEQPLDLQLWVLDRYAALFIGVMLLSFSSMAAAQQNGQGSQIPPAAALLTRTTTRHEVRRFGYGGTVTIIGAPQGSITIEGWSRSEVDITADIELHAETEEDLALLSTINTFALDDSANHLQILTSGTHDKMFMKKVARKFPKGLLGLPWKIDYKIRVPANTDLEINAGSGAISLQGVEGAIRLNALETEASLTLTGGTFSATIAHGKVNFKIPVRSWRGGGADLRLAAGDLTVELPVGFSADIDADILRAGQIENGYAGIESRERPGVTRQTIRGRAGAGGAFLKFTVGAGTIYIKNAVISDK